MSEQTSSEFIGQQLAIPENNERGRTGAPVPHPDSAAKGFADQLEYRAQPRSAGDSLQP